MGRHTVWLFSVVHPRPLRKAKQPRLSSLYIKGSKCFHARVSSCLVFMSSQMPADSCSFDWSKTTTTTSTTTKTTTGFLIDCMC